MDWRPVHADFSIYHKKYFAHGTRLESCYDLELTLKMTGKKSSTTLVFIIFLYIFFDIFWKTPLNPRFNHVFFGFNHWKPGFLNRALDPQAEVLIGWIGARFVPDFSIFEKIDGDANSSTPQIRFSKNLILTYIRQEKEVIFKTGWKNQYVQFFYAPMRHHQMPHQQKRLFFFMPDGFY